MQPPNDLAHPTSWGRSAAAGPATSRGGFREAPLWGQPPSDASATRLAEAAFAKHPLGTSRHQQFQWHKPLKSAEDNSFSIIAHLW